MPVRGRRVRRGRDDSLPATRTSALSERMLEAVFAVSLARLAGGGPLPNAENRRPGSRTLCASGAAPTGARAEA